MIQINNAVGTLYYDTRKWSIIEITRDLYNRYWARIERDGQRRKVPLHHLLAI